MANTMNISQHKIASCSRPERTFRRPKVSHWHICAHRALDTGSRSEHSHSGGEGYPLQVHRPSSLSSAAGQSGEQNASKQPTRDNFGYLLALTKTKYEKDKCGKPIQNDRVVDPTQFAINWLRHFCPDTVRSVSLLREQLYLLFNMAFKFVTFLALVAVAQAGVISGPALSYAAAPALTYAAPVAKTISYAAPAPLGYAAPVTKTLVAAPLAKTVVADEYDPNPQYSYSYGISDALTGDQKEQHESRNGDAVQGSYSLVDADGFKRTVEYTADPIHGFNAVVHREPLVKAAKVVAAAPVAYAAPVAKTISYAAPLATKTIVSQPAYATYAAPLATKTIVSHQPAYTSYAAPALYHH